MSCPLGDQYKCETVFLSKVSNCYAILTWEKEGYKNKYNKKYSNVLSPFLMNKKKHVNLVVLHG